MKKRDIGDLKLHFEEEDAASEKRVTCKKMAVKPVSFAVFFFTNLFFFKRQPESEFFCGLRHKEEYEMKGRDGKNENEWKDNNKKSKRILSNAESSFVQGQRGERSVSDQPHVAN